MKLLNVGTLASVWGLTITGFLSSVLPYVQIVSLCLAISVSIITITKHYKSDGKGKS